MSLHCLFRASFYLRPLSFGSQFSSPGRNVANLLQEVLDDTSLKNLLPGPYDWTCIEVHSPVRHFPLLPIGSILIWLTGLLFHRRISEGHHRCAIESNLWSERQ
jgi:hypothetical protein